jgi:phenylacetic acid degradation protein
MACYAIDGITPVIDSSSFVHPSATVIGDVIIGPGCYVAPNAVLRGDFGRIQLNEGVNIQDTCVMHGFPNTVTLVEKNGHIGHGAVLHGCVIKENALIGMNSVIMDGAIIGISSIVAAMSFVKANEVIADKTLVAGSPARTIRELSEEEIHWKIEGTKDYHRLTKRCFESLKEVEPLTKLDADRAQLDVSDSIPLYKTRHKE